MTLYVTNGVHLYGKRRRCERSQIKTRFGVMKLDTIQEKRHLSMILNES